MASQLERARAIVKQAGRTYCKQAGFTLRDKPSPLYQLLVLATLLAKPIGGDIAVAACAELRKAGMRTPQRMLDATWQQRVDALTRAHYRRYDESTATRLGESAELLLERYRGDLRRLAEESEHDVGRAADLLEQIPGIGPTGASIFLREAQQVWPWLRPYVDDRMADGAGSVGLPRSRDALARLTEQVPAAEFAAALVRASLDDELATQLRG